MKLEHLGIDQEVRVCDGCYKKLKTPGGRRYDDMPVRMMESANCLVVDSASISQQRVASSTASQINGAKKSQEEIDFERAIALSLAESSSSAPSDPYTQSNNLPGVGYGYEAKPSKPSTSSQNVSALPSKQMEEDDPDLAAAIRASLADAPPQASTSAAASAPPKATYAYVPAVQPSVPSYELLVSEFDALDSFSNALRDPHIRPEDANELFTRADRHRGKMYRALEDAHAKSSMLAELNQKLQHAVRLYDSLLERNISRYNQPYQAPPQQYYQNPQTSSQPYHTDPSYQPPQQQHTVQRHHSANYASHQQSYTLAPQPQIQSSYQAYHEPQYATQPPLQHSNSYQSAGQPTSYIQEVPENYQTTQAQPYQATGEAYQATGEDGQYHLQHPPTSPPQQHSTQTYAGQQQPSAGDEQYYNSYPPEAEDQALPHQPVNGYSYGQHVEERPYIQSQTNLHHSHSASQVEPASSDHEQGTVTSHEPPQAQNVNTPNGRFQGFYSANSFPAVPTMPVGGLPEAPKGQFRDTEPESLRQESRKEEALIEF